MSAPAMPEVFVNLKNATVRGSRNYHRLEQLGRRDTHALHEETITDLLLAEMAGRHYVVDAACPGGCASTGCVDWEGGGQVSQRGLQVRALTKLEEGGNRRRKRKGAHADFVLAVANCSPELSDDLSGGPQIRLMVQAKRITPGARIFLPSRKERSQYDGLRTAATAAGAAPYYALYVQQLDAHASTATRCARHRTAADRAIVLVPAGAGRGYLPGKAADQVIPLGRPLRCLAGCSCTKTLSGPQTPWVAVGAFVQADFPRYVATELPPVEDVPQVKVNAGLSKPGPEPLQPTAVDEQGEVLLVRLGPRRATQDPQRPYIGYADGLTAHELRDTARRYWRLAPARAQLLRYLVVGSGRQVLRAYRIEPDGLTFNVDDKGNSRASFELAEIADGTLNGQLLRQAGEALEKLPSGSQNPVMYLGKLGADSGGMRGHAERPSRS